MVDLAGVWAEMMPTYQDDAVTLLHGDCRDVLGLLGDESVDAIVTDPPYGTTSLTWDVPVVGWLVLAERVLRPSASVWIFGSMRSLAPIVADADAGRLGAWRFAQDIVWEKHNGSSFHADRFKRVHEQAVQLYRGAWSDVFHETPTTPDAIRRVVRRKKGRPAHTGHIEQSSYASEDGGPRLQRSVIAVRSCHGHAVHPTQKPEGIIRPLIAYSVPPGGTVLDPFAGSGTTGVVARELGRRAVLIETDASYIAAASERLAQLPLVGAA